jgi:hypothetical protein
MRKINKCYVFSFLNPPIKSIFGCTWVSSEKEIVRQNTVRKGEQRHWEIEMTTIKRLTKQKNKLIENNIIIFEQLPEKAIQQV